MNSFDVFHNYEKNHWTLRDIRWDRIDRDRVKPEYVTLARSAVMGECNSIAALHGFLNESTDDYDFAAYASIWGYQELQHHYAFKTWLRHVDRDVEPRPVEATRPPYPPGVTHAATLATNVISELTVCHVYLNVSSSVEEPVLKELLSRASQDEARHAREFIYYTRRRLERHPEELPSVLETLYVYVADPDRDIKHPVSVFKGDLTELRGHETIDDGFAYFQAMDAQNLSRLRDKLYATFSSLTGFKLSSPATVRRALAEAVER